jgi:hypothetical protein
MRVDNDAVASARDDALVGERGFRGAYGGLRARGRRAMRWRPKPEHVVVLALGLVVLVVHDLGYLLRQPFWVDEAWAAVTTRFPLSQLPATTSSSPIGWSLLLGVVRLGGDQRLRLLPLAFAGAAVAIAYWFARRLDWRRREASVIAGVLAAVGVLLIPAMLTRNDLKQYTADACMALLILAVTSRLERQWSRRGLVGLSVAVWGGMLFSHTAAFVGVAAFGALCIVQLARRAWGRLLEATVVGAGTAVLMLGVYKAFDARAVVSGLTAYWSHYYLPIGNGVHAGIQFVRLRFDELHAYFGLGPAWLVVALFIAGLVTIVRLGRPATALTAFALWPEMLAVSALKKYPFLDLRTSTFLFAVTVMVAAIGVAGLCSMIRPRLKGLVPATIAALIVVAFAANAQPFARQHTIVAENVRDQALYVAAHATPRDVTVVNLSSNWGFAYYWPIGHPSRRPDPVVFQGYEAYFPDQPRIIVARDRDVAAVEEALSEARTKALQHPDARIWLIQTHVNAGERTAWDSALKTQGLIAKPIGQDGLLLVKVS